MLRMESSDKAVNLKQLGLVAAGAAIAIAVVLYVLLQPAMAPAAQFITLKGEKIATADLRGKVVLVNFWATDCVACVQEMPRIVETYNKFAPQGFETIAVAMSYDPPNYVLNYAEKNRLPFKVALDTSGELARRFGNVRFTPMTFLIARDGRIAGQYLGEPDFAALQALVERELGAG
jgi:peroxiredoxin